MNAKTISNKTEVAAALAEIAERNDGRLTPQQVFLAAKDEKSPLHRHFTWSDAKAAGKHRLNEARELIRSVRVVTHHERQPAPSCFYCGTTERDRPLRPYGPRGEWVCFPCAIATPERKAETEAAFDAQLKAAGPEVVLGESTGPRPLIGESS